MPRNQRGKEKEDGNDNNDFQERISINVTALKTSVHKELGVNLKSPKPNGEDIVNTFLANIILTTYINVLIEIALNNNISNYKADRPIVYFPTASIRSRNLYRNHMRQQKNYDIVYFSDTYEVLRVRENVAGGGNYGYMYFSGSNVVYNSMGSNLLIYDSYNMHLTTNFNGYAYIKFEDQDKKYVGDLLFKTVELRDKFVNYFNVTLREKIKQDILKNK